MDLSILEKFKPENFEKYNSEEKTNAIKALIQSIIVEKNLSDVTFEVGDGFGYNAKENTIILPDFNLQEENKVSSYEILTGIIHEMRHKEQADKGKLDPLIYQGFAYYISPNELDAHNYTSKTLMKLSPFFNDDKFDIYLLNLLETDSNNQKSSKEQITRLGYTDKPTEEYARMHSEFVDNYVCKKNPMDKGQTGITPNGKYLMTYFEEDDILNVGVGSTLVYYKDGNLYLNKLVFLKDIDTKDIARDLAEAIKVIDECYEGEHIVKEIKFPPELIELGISKAQYDELVRLWGVKDGSIKVEQLEEITEKQGIQLLRVREQNDYESKYTPEQLEIIELAREKEDEFLAVKAGWMDEEEVKPGFIVMSQYKPEFSPEKLRLIYAAQINNLNTVMYEKLSEEQIKEVMLAQLNGLTRSDVLEIVNGKEDFKLARLRKQAEKGIKPRVKQIDLTDDFDIILPDDGQTLEGR